MVNPNTFREWPKLSLKRTGKPTFKKSKKPKKRDTYDPEMMLFDGATGYYQDVPNDTGNFQTAMVRVNVAPKAGASQHILGMVNAATDLRLTMQIFASDHATVEHRNRCIIIAENNSGLLVSRYRTKVEVATSSDVFIFFSQNVVTSAVGIYVNGTESDDLTYTGRLNSNGTLAGATGNMSVGATAAGTLEFLAGQVGYFGYSNVYLTNPTDFYHPTYGLQEIDESGWTEWGGTQPWYWNKFAELDDSKGSKGNMTKNGVITGPT